MSRTLLASCCVVLAVGFALGIALPPLGFQWLSHSSRARPPESQPAGTGGTSVNASADPSRGLGAEGPPKGISAVWANEGGDKVAQDEQRAASGNSSLRNSVWDGQKISLFGAKNEVVAFNLVIEAVGGTSAPVAVKFDALAAPNFTIKSDVDAATDVFDWRNRDIELFFVRYLPIRGLSRLSYETYDEQHVPERFQAPPAVAHPAWTERRDHDRSYPDIAVPIERVGRFEIAPGQNQSIWVDIFIPKDAPPGTYSGEILIAEGEVTQRLPVQLQVRNFMLPDQPAARTMVATSYHDVSKRYLGKDDIAPGSDSEEALRRVMDRQMLLAHRHKISLVDDNAGAGAWPQDSPRPEWIPRLTGSLFTAANGYRGPGEAVGNNIFAIGTYGQWKDWWGPPTRTLLWSRTDQWESWFEKNAPDTERFLYLADESEAYGDLERWARWIRSNPGPGAKLSSFATVDLLKATELVPSLDITASWFRTGITEAWQRALGTLRSDRRKRFYLYNAHRPGSGSFAIEDDGVALRELAWGQYKKKIDRWFYWNATYYDDYQGGRGPTDVFVNAQTFGGAPARDLSLGMTGWNYSNGDGVLFYPGMDAIFPSRSYGLAGPMASLRLKYWRRGIQDVDYLALAEKVSPERTAAIVERLIPKVLWEYGVSDPADPTWVRGPISWSNNPNDWEGARKELADIIESGVGR